MFKRVLVLVLFLFGVFWWLTHRGGDEPQEPTSDIVTVETTEGEEAVEGETESEEAGEYNEKKEEVVKTETVETTVPVVTTTTTLPATTTSPVVTSAPPVVTAPVTPPVVARPSVPARTTDVKVYVYEWSLDLSDKTIPAGTVNFKVQNDGRFTHDFNISGFGNLGKIMPGETKTFTVKLKVGDYEAFSKRRQDYERGVEEPFTVTP